MMSRSNASSARRRRDLRTLLALCLMAAGFLAVASREVAFHWLDATLGNRPLNAARSWHYHLTRLDLDTILKSEADVVVTEYSANIDDFKAWSADEVARMKSRSDGRKRPVLAYFSIGEAESYRFYWRPEWEGTAAPSWLGPENCAWPRNFMVRFWQDGWRDIMVGGPDSFLKRIVAAGFDGVYLDRIDVYTAFEKERPSAREDMISFVSEIAETGRKLRPGFLVVAQNAEELLVERRYRDMIDGLGKEDLLFGGSGTNTRNDPDDVSLSLQNINALRRNWKPVFAVEYVTEPALIRSVRAELVQHGLIATIAHRSLDGLPPDSERGPSTIRYGTPEWIEAQCKDKPHW